MQVVRTVPATVTGDGDVEGDGDGEVAGDSLATAGFAASRGAASPSALVNDKPSPAIATTARPIPPAVALTGKAPHAIGCSRRATLRCPVT